MTDHSSDDHVEQRSYRYIPVDTVLRTYVENGRHDVCPTNDEKTETKNENKISGPSNFENEIFFWTLRHCIYKKKT